MIPTVLLFIAAGCKSCHGNEARTQPGTPMARTLTPVAKSAFLQKQPDLSFSSGSVRYRIHLAAGVATYTASAAGASISEPLVWAFGSGNTGQTYLFQHNDSWYEGAVSYFPAIQGLDWTLGHATRPHNELEEALGRKLDAIEARRCFGCHSTSATWTAAGSVTVAPGVTCERCHRGASAHAAAVAKGNAKGAFITRLGALGPEDLSAVCSECHPSWAEVATNGPRGLPNVRHQFFRLTSSRCYSSDDQRIACTVCHDVHAHTVRQVGFYDAKCAGCHATGRTCPVAKSDCVTCHMPKVEIQGLHHQYTDHWIRVARPGEKYPD
jgi:hypothetical protein